MAMSDGGRVELLSYGAVPAEAMFKGAEESNRIMAWFLRMLGFLMMAFDGGRVHLAIPSASRPYLTSRCRPSTGGWSSPPARRTRPHRRGTRVVSHVVDLPPAFPVSHKPQGVASLLACHRRSSS